MRAQAGSAQQNHFEANVNLLVRFVDFLGMRANQPVRCELVMRVDVGLISVLRHIKASWVGRVWKHVTTC